MPRSVLYSIISVLIGALAFLLWEYEGVQRERMLRMERYQDDADETLLIVCRATQIMLKHCNCLQTDQGTPIEVEMECSRVRWQHGPH